MYEFKTELNWNGGQRCTAASPGKPTIAITPPPEFGGPEGTWTPEDQLVSAIETCMLLTTLSIVQRQKIELRAYTSKATGHMEKTPAGLRFTKIDIAVTATVAQPEEVEKFKKAVAMAEKYCPVFKAVNIPVSVEVNVTP